MRQELEEKYIILLKICYFISDWLDISEYEEFEFDFKLTYEDKRKIAILEQSKSQLFSHVDSETIIILQLPIPSVGWWHPMSSLRLLGLYPIPSCSYLNELSSSCLINLEL